MLIAPFDRESLQLRPPIGHAGSVRARSSFSPSKRRIVTFGEMSVSQTDRLVPHRETHGRPRRRPPRGIVGVQSRSRLFPRGSPLYRSSRDISNAGLVSTPRPVSRGLLDDFRSNSTPYPKPLRSTCRRFEDDSQLSENFSPPITDTNDFLALFFQHVFGILFFRFFARIKFERSTRHYECTVRFVLKVSSFTTFSITFFFQIFYTLAEIEFQKKKTSRNS